MSARYWRFNELCLDSAALQVALRAPIRFCGVRRLFYNLHLPNEFLSL